MASKAKKISVEEYKPILFNVVHSSAVGLGEVMKKYVKKADREEFLRTYVAKIGLFSGEMAYMYVYAFDGTCVALTNFKDLEGTNLMDLVDTHGTHTIRELIKLAKKGGGYLEYYWHKPGKTTDDKKISYVEQIAGTEYLIGLGAYI